MRRGSLLLFLAIAGLTVVLMSCGGKPAPPALSSAWFQLYDGAFSFVTGPAAAAPVARRPWTVASRVADMAFLNGTLYCALNGNGLATLALDSSGQPVFVYHPDSIIFSHRTVTTLVPRDGTLTVHLYYNALLNDVSRADLTLNGVSVVAFLPAQSEYSFLIPPFQRANPDWEAVGFAPESENSFDLQWKYTDAAETRFSYTRFHADTRAEETVSKEIYQAAMGVAQITEPAVPADLATFFADCKTRLGLPAATSLQFSLRSRESPVRRNYRSHAEADAAVQVPVFEETAVRYALLPDGHVLDGGRDGAGRVVDLPALPAGFRYTDIVKAGLFFVIPWEESTFTDTGRAGILVFPVSR